MYQKYRDRGFEIVPITLMRTSQEWIEDYARKHDLNYHFLMEKDDSVARNLFKVKLQGYVCFVDREGKIRYFIDKWLGDNAIATYETLTKQLLGE